MAVTRTVPLTILLNELDRLRRESGVGSERAAQELGCRVSKISRIQLGQSKVSAGDTRLLAELYGASPELTSVLVDLARHLGRRGDWPGYQSVYAESFSFLLDLERHSTRTRMAQPEIVPGLLQTEDYVRALYAAPGPLQPRTDVDEAVRASRRRQEILTRDGDRPQFSFVLSESALRREHGDAGVMSGQMRHLLEVASWPNVQLQVLPFRNANPVVHTSVGFVLFHIPGPGSASPLDFVYLEQYGDARYLDEHDQVAAYEQLWGILQAAALGPADSAAFVEAVAEEYSTRK